MDSGIMEASLELIVRWKGFCGAGQNPFFSVHAVADFTRGDVFSMIMSKPHSRFLVRGWIP
ncbi:hypothetical protein C169_11582 [Paenibacillus sp. FSL R5-808]|nr:hypothetical protein C169_11582 [Paenibacillus sp. FSL R5-808]